MDNGMLERIVGNATKVFIGLVLIPFCSISDNKGVNFEIDETFGHSRFHIKGKLDKMEGTGSMVYEGETFYFKYDKNGLVMPTGKSAPYTKQTPK